MFTNIRPKKIIYSGVATIVYWLDGSKTVVKRSEGAPDDRYAAFCAALAKKLYNTNSQTKRLIRKAEEYKGKVTLPYTANDLDSVISKNIMDSHIKRMADLVASYDPLKWAL